jgi:hypothetical protein
MMKRLMLSVMALVLVMACGEKAPEFSNLEHGDKNYWHDVKFVPDTTDPQGERGQWSGWFRQEVVDASNLEDGSVRARVDGKWQEFDVVDLHEDFLEWNYEHRLEQLAGFKRMMAGEKFTPVLSGPHDGIVASHGTKRKDSHFEVNNAVKGIGWLPRRDKLDELIELYKATWDDPMPTKLSVLESLYQRGAEIFDPTIQTSLELYARPNFETHTFLNQMEDPGVALVFLDLPKSYELRCIVHMLHPDDPDLTEYEKKAVEYINLVHDYFHGRMPWKSTGVLYYVVQVFDNSPPKGRGRRVVPPLP